MGRDWEDGLPWLMLAVREVAQESMGFSPNKLVFGLSVRGPTAVVADEWKSAEVPENVLDYVSDFHLRLYRACVAAKRSLGKAQTKMQRLFDRNVKERSFKAGDQMLALLPVIGSPFQAKFAGPYEVETVISDEII